MSPTRKGKGNYIMKAFIQLVKDLFSGQLLKDMVDAGVIDHSGQGRNKYGK